MLLPALVATLAVASLPASAPAPDLAPTPAQAAAPPAPPAGVALRTTHAVTEQLAFRSMTATVDGREVPAEYLPALDVQAEATTVLTVVDRGTGPASWTRSYEELERTAAETVELQGEVTAEARRWSTPLVGRAVAFDCDAEDCAASWASGERGSDAWLAGLAPRADLGALQPAEGQDGESWSVGAEAARALLWPGGELPLELKEGEPDGFGPPALDGELRVTRAGEREVDGRRCERLAFSGTCTETASREVELTFVPVSDGLADEVRATEVRLEGELWRDAATGLLVAAEARGDVTATATIDRHDDQPGPDFTSTVVLTGAVSIDVRVEREE